MRRPLLLLLLLTIVASAALPPTATALEIIRRYSTGRFTFAAGAGAWDAGGFAPLLASLRAAGDGSRGTARVLLLGDSNDRRATVACCSADAADARAREACDSSNASWAAGLTYYLDGMTAAPNRASRYCGGAACPSARARDSSSYASQGVDWTRGNHSVASVHLFGARARGPYTVWGRHAPVSANTSGADAWTDTVDRLPAALDRYRAAFGAAPTLIVYQSLLWDLFGRAHADRLSGTAVREYSVRMRGNVHALQRLLPPGTTLALRTVPFHGGRGGAPLAHAVATLNDAIRRVAADARIGVVDWAGMLSDGRSRVGGGGATRASAPRPRRLRRSGPSPAPASSAFETDGVHMRPHAGALAVVSLMALGEALLAAT